MESVSKNPPMRPASGGDPVQQLCEMLGLFLQPKACGHRQAFCRAALLGSRPSSYSRKHAGRFTSHDIGRPFAGLGHVNFRVSTCIRFTPRLHSRQYVRRSSLRIKFWWGSAHSRHRIRKCGVFKIKEGTQKSTSSVQRWLPLLWISSQWESISQPTIPAHTNSCISLTHAFSFTSWTVIKSTAPFALHTLIWYAFTISGFPLSLLFLAVPDTDAVHKTRQLGEGCSIAVGPLNSLADLFLSFPRASGATRVT